MVPELEQHREAIIALCRQYQVQRLEVFGSAATGRYVPGRSDLDFIVEFAPQLAGTIARHYFAFVEALEQVVGVPVDAIILREEWVTNPGFLAEVNRSRKVLYENSGAQLPA